MNGVLADRVAGISARLLTAMHAVERCQDVVLDEALKSLDALGGQHAADTAIDELRARREQMLDATRTAWAVVNEVAQLDLDLVTGGLSD